MIELNDENDPMLFAVTLPTGRLVVQYMEVLSTIHATMNPDAQPTQSEIADGLRRSSRTPEVAASASDAMLVAAWARMSARVSAAGNG